MKKVLANILFCIMGLGLLGQVFDPNDPIIIYDPDNPPQTPSWGTMSKWIVTPWLSWNSDKWKAYYYNQVPFRLRFPNNYDPNRPEPYPVIVILHGRGFLDGTIYMNEKHMHNAGAKFFENALNQNKFDGFVISPQANTGFFGNGHFNAVESIVAQLDFEHNIDINRVNLHGRSAGGQAVWRFLKEKPQLFAAASPFSGVVTHSSSAIEIYKHVSIWIFQGGLDTNPTPFTTENVIDDIVSIGGHVKYAKWPDEGHDLNGGLGLFGLAYNEPEYFNYNIDSRKFNPIVLRGQMVLIDQTSQRELHEYQGDSDFCPNEPALALTPGFEDYEWRKDGQLLPGENGHELMVNQSGMYSARIKRNSTWSEWSTVPHQINAKPITATPVIATNGLVSQVLPAPDGTTSIDLILPGGFSAYSWYETGNPTVIGTDSSLTVSSPGSYEAIVTEAQNCSSYPSVPFNVVDAQGPNGPDPATGLSGFAVSDSVIQLNWNQNPNPQFNETGFEVYVATAQGGPYTFVNITTPDIISFNHTSLFPGQTYYYIVRAVNENGAALVSEEIGLTTLVDETPPSAPLNLALVSAEGDSIKLSWDANVEPDLASYTLYRGGSPGVTPTAPNLLQDNLTTTTYTDNGLSLGTYYYIITASDFSGNESVASNEVNGEIVPDTSPPADPTGLLSIDVTETTIDLDWDDNPEGDLSGYNLYRSNTSGFNTGPANLLAQGLTVSDYQDTGLSPSVNYYYRVTAEDLAGNESGPSAELGVQTLADLTPPGTPQNPVLTVVSSTDIFLNWDDNTEGDLGEYSIYRANSSGFTPDLTNLLSGGLVLSEYSDTTLDPNLSYYYLITASDTVGNESPPSIELMVGAANEVNPPMQVAAQFTSINGVDGIEVTWVDPNPGQNSDLHVYVLGSSTANGSGASSVENQWADGHFQQWLLDNFTGTVFDNIAASGLKTTDILSGSTPGRNVDVPIGEGTVDLTIINLPSNDSNAGILPQTQIDNLNSAKSDLETAGIKVLITSTQPRTGNLTLRQELAHLADPTPEATFNNGVSYATAFTPEFIQNYPELVENGIAEVSDPGFTGYVDPLLDADGIHVNDGGHFIIYENVRDKVLEWINTETEVEQFIVERQVDGGAYVPIATLTDPFTRYFDTTHPPTGVFRYRLKAANGTYTSGPGTPSPPVNIGQGIDPFVDITDWVSATRPTGADTELAASNIWVNEGSGNDLDQVGTHNLPGYDGLEQAVDFDQANMESIRYPQPKDGIEIFLRFKLKGLTAAPGRNKQMLMALCSGQRIFIYDSGMITIASEDVPGFTFEAEKWYVLRFTIYEGSSNVNSIEVNRDEFTHFTLTSSNNSLCGKGVLGSLNNGNNDWMDGYISHLFVRDAIPGTLTPTQQNDMWSWFELSAPWDGASTPPSAPQSLVGNALGPSSIFVDWADNTEPDLDYYNVYRSTQSGFIPGGGNLISSSTSSDWTDTGLQPATTYYYQVTAFNTSGQQSGPSTELGIETDPDVTPPSPPSSLAVTAVSSEDISLDWSDNTEPDLATYSVYRDNSPGVVISPANLIASGLPQSFYDDGSLIPSTTYHYVITAIDQSGNESAGSSEGSATTFADTTPPATPLNLQVILSGVDGADLIWQANTETDLQGYHVYRDLTAGFTPGPGNQIASSIVPNMYTDAGLTPGTTYHYIVSALDVYGNESSPTASVPILIPDNDPPASPTGLASISVTASAIGLDWNDNAEGDLQGYHLYRGNQGGFIPDPGNRIGNMLLTSQYDDSGLSPATDYYYVVTAVDQSGNESPPSAELQEQTTQDITPPSAPTGLSVSVTGSESLTIDWSDNTEPDLSGYNLYRGTATGFPLDVTHQLASDVTMSDYNDTGLIPQTTYYYVVTAVDLVSNESAGSSEASGTTLQDTTPPAIPGGFTAILNGTDAADLSWQANGESDLAGYNLYRDINPGVVPGPSTQVAVLITSTTYQDTGLATETTYYYVLTAEDIYGNVSTSSSEANVTTPDITSPAIPTGLNAINITSSQISLDWDDNIEPDLSGYNLHRDVQSGFTPGPTNLIAGNVPGSNFDDTGLPSNTQHFYRLSAIDISGNESGYTLEFSATTLDNTGPTLNQVVQINIVNSNTAATSTGWENVNLKGLPTGVTTFSNLINSQETASGISLDAHHKVNSSFINNVANNGTGLINGIFPDEVLQHAAYTTGRADLYLTGLFSDRTYTITIHGGRAASGTRITDYTVDGITLSLECVNNTDNVIQFSEIVPDTNNEISVNITGQGTWGYFNAIVVEEYLTGGAGARVVREKVNENPEVESFSTINVYPNPIRDRLYLELDQSLYEARLIDLSGRIIWKRSGISGFQVIDIQNVKDGTYFLRLVSGEKNATFTLIVEGN